MTDASRLPNANRPESLTMSSRKKHLSLKSAVVAVPRPDPPLILSSPHLVILKRRTTPPRETPRAEGSPGLPHRDRADRGFYARPCPDRQLQSRTVFRSFRPGSTGMGCCPGLQDDKVGCAPPSAYCDCSPAPSARLLRPLAPVLPADRLAQLLDRDTLAGVEGQRFLKDQILVAQQRKRPVAILHLDAERPPE